MSIKIEQIRLRNYRSIKDATVQLSDINLFIGANNSGKSNFLKGIRDVWTSVGFNERRRPLIESTAIVFNKSLNQLSLEDPFGVEIIVSNSATSKAVSGSIEFFGRTEFDHVFRLTQFDTKAENALQKNAENTELFYFSYSDNRYGFDKPAVGKIQSQIDKMAKFEGFGLSDGLGNENAFNGDYNKVPQIEYLGYKSPGDWVFVERYSRVTVGKIKNVKHITTWDNESMEILFKKLINLPIYKINLSKITKPAPLDGDETIKEDGSNLVSFIDQMIGSNPTVMKAINLDLKVAIPEFESIIIEAIRTESPDFKQLQIDYKRDTFKKFGVLDVNGNKFWSNELSDGALFFIAILCIIHQPNPPDLLMLEEIETGIHPRRIAEVCTLIQRLAREKNIQVIMTTHSPLVVDEFSNNPAGIHVFDKINGATVVKNLETDILANWKNSLGENYSDEFDLTNALGENWILGLINGVPEQA